MAATIMMTGGSGLLGQAVAKLDPTILLPARAELDICDRSKVIDCLRAHKPDIVIHAAAIVDNREVELQPAAAIDANIAGTINVALACMQTGARLVYISTDYIYRGDRGHYRETDEIAPFNLYAWTKLGGECAVRSVSNHLIIRTSFGPDRLAYRVAFTDKWLSKDRVGVIAPMILEAATSRLVGVLNLGSERKSVFDLARAHNPDVRPLRLAESSLNTPRDTSLDLGRWHEYRAKPEVTVGCRGCGSQRLTKQLDLGAVPLASPWAKSASEARERERYPLQRLSCDECGLVQSVYGLFDGDDVFAQIKDAASIGEIGRRVFELRQGGESVAAFGATAAGVTLLNAARLTADLVDYVVDTAPDKVGMFCPGSAIPIVHPTMLNERPPDYLLILAQRDEVLASTKPFATRGGRYLVPLPRFAIV